MKVKLEGGKSYQPKPDDPVVCEDHGVTVKWKDLGPVQKLAVASGLDIQGRVCILSKKYKC